LAAENRFGQSKVSSYQADLKRRYFTALGSCARTLVPQETELKNAGHFHKDCTRISERTLRSSQRVLIMV